MIHTVQLTTAVDLMEYLDFVTEAIAKVCAKDYSIELIKRTFDDLRFSIGHDDTSVWIQLQGERPIAFCVANILVEPNREAACWLRLVYARPGAYIKESLEKDVIPWAKERGAMKIQVGNSELAPRRARAKALCFYRYGLTKKFEVFERKIL